MSRAIELARGLLLQPLPLLLLCGGLGLVGLDNLFHIHGAELMRIIAVRGAACRAVARFLLLNPMPTPHTNLVPAFAGEELLIGYIELFAAQRTNVTIFHLVAFYVPVGTRQT